MPRYNATLDQTCLLAGAAVETLFYGFYLCLFTFAMYLMTHRTPGDGPRLSARASLPSKIFFGAIIFMFIMATFHEIITIFRLIRGYGLMLGPKGTPLSYYYATYTWDNYTHTVMNAIMTWIADALVIYRCYIIWGSSPYQRHVIILPILLLLAAMGVNITLMVWFGHPFSSYEEIKVVLNLNYPLFFAQNVLTTGLIAYRIIKQHRRSKAAGIMTGSIGAQNGTSLLTIARIIVESAALYTFEIALLIVLYFADHPAQYIVRGAIIPTIGIVFVLIAIRVHVAREGLCPPSHSRGGSSDTEAPVWALSTYPIFKVDSVRSSTYSQDTLSPGMDREEDDDWRKVHLELAGGRVQHLPVEAARANAHGVHVRVERVRFSNV